MLGAHLLIWFSQTQNLSILKEKFLPHQTIWFWECESIENIISKNNLEYSDIDSIIHATTQTSNAIIEQNDLNVCLITSYGFRDIIEIGKNQDTSSMI